MGWNKRIVSFKQKKENKCLKEEIEKLKKEAEVLSNEVDKYNDKQIMILAMKVMMDREDNKVSVKFRFYQKYMANKTVVSAYNAVPIRMVFNTPIDEVMRRMRNTSPSLLPDENR